MKIRMTMMSGKEKLYFLLNRIDDVRVIAPSGQPLKIHPMDDLNGKYRDTELTQLFTKLAKDAQVIKILRTPNRIKTIDFVEGIIPDEPVPENDDGCWHIELLPAFDNYFLKIQQEPEYQEFSGRKPLQPTIQEETKQVPRIVNEFSPENYSFVLMVLKKIASLTEFSTDNEVNYKLQSPFGQAVIQERSLLKKFEARGLFKHLGEDGVFGIATLGDVDLSLVRQIIAEIEERESGVISEEKFEDIKKKYNRTLQGLRERNQPAELKERYNRTLDEIKSKAISSITLQRPDVQEQNRPLVAEIDLTDTSSRRAYEKKWDVLQAIWDVYESHSRPDSILVPVARLTIKDRHVELIDGIIEGLKNEDLFQKWDRKDRWYNLEFINHEKLPEVYKDTGEIYKKLATAYQEQSKNLTCGNLRLDLAQSVIQYKDNPPTEISTGINIIKLLIYLMENKRVVEYIEIAQKIKLNCYHEGVTNKDVAREVQFLRRDLGDFLVKIGMSKTEIQGMFISKKNVGYKLRCSD